MPEGPSILILKEQALQFKKKKVLDISGNTKEDIGPLQGKIVTDIRSWGKHFLICFNKVTVRIHLMMFGSYRINEEKDAEPRLHIRFANGEINFYTCSVKILPGNVDELYDFTTDVMSDTWNPRIAKTKLLQQPDMLVCDALLDQQIFSGVGNIIKNEVLFRIKVHPESKVGSLPPRKLNELIKEARIYSFQFLEWKKKFELKKHWLANTKKICPRDHVAFNKGYLGKTHRRTFYCDICQQLYS